MYDYCYYYVYYFYYFYYFYYHYCHPSFSFSSSCYYHSY